MAKKKLTETDEGRSIPQAKGETLKVAVGERAPRARRETDGELVGQEARATQSGEKVGAFETVDASATSVSPKKRASRARRKAGEESDEIGELSARDDGDCRSSEIADASSPHEGAPKKRAPRARRKASTVVDSPASQGEQASASTVSQDETIASPGQSPLETPSIRKRVRENGTGGSGDAASERGGDKDRQSASNAAASSGDSDEAVAVENAPDGSLDVADAGESQGASGTNDKWAAPPRTTMRARSFAYSTHVVSVAPADYCVGGDSTEKLNASIDGEKADGKLDVEQEDAEPSAKGHVSRDETWNNGEALTMPGSDYRFLYDPTTELPKTFFVEILRADYEKLKRRYSGRPTAAAQDLAPALQSLVSPRRVGVRLPIDSRRRSRFCQWLRASGIMSYFDENIREFNRYLIDPWFSGRELLSPNPGGSPLYTPPQLRSHPVNPSRYMSLHADDEPEPQFMLPPLETLEAQARIRSVFEIFEASVRPLVHRSADHDACYKAHVMSHVARITGLVGDWIRCLDLINDGVHGGPFNLPLSKMFIDRFERIMMVDIAAAGQQGCLLPDLVFQERFDLSNADLVILWILISIEADSGVRNVFDEVWRNQRVMPVMCPWFLSQMLASNAAERAALLETLSPSGNLVSLGFIRITPNASPVMSLFFELAVAEQVRNAFIGIRSLSIYSSLFAELLTPHFSEETFMAKTHLKALGIVKNFINRPNLSGVANLERENLNFIPSMAFLVEGLPGSGRSTLVKLIASKLEKSVVVVQGYHLTTLSPGECDDVLRAIFVDAMVMQALICIKDSSSFLTDERLAATLARHLARFPVVCALCADLAVKMLPVIEPYITFKTKMDADLRDTAAAMWRQHIALPFSETGSTDVVLLSQQMALQPFQIQKATKLAYYSTDFNPDDQVEITNDKLERAAAVQVTKNIGNLAFVSDPEITLDDVIVSDDIMTKIHQIIGSAINRRRVLYEWGLSRRIRRGTGVIALFDGEPGTGKTHSAEAIAKTLGLSLMRINIATMVDKYIGETEKNLTTIFEQARPDMQLLLFDEADSLFTKRTANVSKSNDRYSNMSINVLLQLVERYEGVSILTTNLKNAIDPAFERRITYKVYFPMPKKPERERLWRYMCPPDIKTAEPIDYDWLSELELSGGEIKNAVLTAAFRAATKGVLLDSEILYDSGVSEATAAGRVMRRYDENVDDMFS